MPGRDGCPAGGGVVLKPVDALTDGQRPWQLARLLPASPAGQGAAWRSAGCLAVCALAFQFLTGPSAAAQTSTPGSSGAVSPGNSGTGNPGQAGITPQTPAAVPQASTAATPSPGQQTSDQVGPTLPPLAANLEQYAGLKVQDIRYEGVDFTRTDKLTAELSQRVGEPFDPQKVRATTRRLFATGRYRDIAVRAERTGDGVVLIFAGIARYYVGQIKIEGVKDDRLASLLEYGTQLNPGTAYTASQIPAATAAVTQVLAQNGYYQPVIFVRLDRDVVGQQVNVTYTVNVGPQARIGNVTVAGKDPGITLATFRKKGKLKRKSKVTRDTTSTALSDLRAIYQKNNRLEATVSLQKSTYDPATKTLNYDFAAEQGPLVKVMVDGVKISKSRLHLLVPIFEEGTIDHDLLYEGRYKIKDFMQQSGYFDATVEVKVEGEGTENQSVIYTVDKGLRHKVLSVTLKGNKYFGTEELTSRLQVQKADLYQRSGRYSGEVVKADESNLQALYRANGFAEAKVTSSVNDISEAKGKQLKVDEIAVTYTIDEGTQRQFGSVDLNGVTPARENDLTPLLSAREGQPFSLIALSGDRDALLGYYLSNGFDKARVEVKQTVDPTDKTRTDVAFNVTEGPQVSIGRVLESGVHYTRPRVVNDQLTFKAEDPLDQSALLQTQRNLYNLALFNEVNVAVQNPDGDAENKNVLVQITEAKRWDVTYGFGFEAQTGTPSRGLYQTAQGTTAAQEGKAGVSPRVSLDVSRINLFGTEKSLTFHGSYGLLEEIATVSFQNPHLRGSNKFALQLSGGYSNVQDITTFASSTLQADVRITQKQSRTNTFIYDFVYRRVAVDPNSLSISQFLIPLLSQPVRVAGPQFTWYHDTRYPTQLDAHKGYYTSVQNFLATSKVGSQTDFNRTDISYSSYYQFGKRQYVFARNTRIGFIDNFGSNPNTSSLDCAGALLQTNASCNAVPLPERLYAGGATSHRGFPINGAGPRDLQTGYPVGGSAVFINSLELRLPAPTLPIVGDSVSFVLFHDMGNVFQNVGDMFPSIKRFHQPNEQTCEVITGVSFGTCDFRYFSHAVGLGARYKTPVGPIRVDFAYNLNPPKYPVITGVLNAPFVGQGSHFNFFFSIGQSF